MTEIEIRPLHDYMAAHSQASYYIARMWWLNDDVFDTVLDVVRWEIEDELRGWRP